MTQGHGFAAALPRHRVPHRRGHTRRYVRTTINIRIMTNLSIQWMQINTYALRMVQGLNKCCFSYFMEKENHGRTR